MSIIGLAPMDGFTDCAFRQIVKEIFDKYGEKDKYELVLWTEFMNADGYIINPPGVMKHLLTDKTQSPVIAQIFGGNEDMLMKCFADIQTKYGTSGKLKIDSLNGKLQSPEKSGKIENGKFSFAGIELNMGCPARNVMNTGGGSALLKDRKKTLELIKKLRKTVKMPFSIKTRTGLNEADQKAQFDFLIEASNFCDMITIHGRTTNKVYSGEADWKFIYELKKQIEGERNKGLGTRDQEGGNKCKVVGNGGIKRYEEIETFLHCHSEQSEESSKNSLYPSLHSGGQSKCLDGIMIGQAAIGNPRIFTPHVPSREEIKDVVLKHLDYMISYENYFQEQKIKYKDILVMPEHLNINVTNPQAITLAEFRKHLFQYIKGIPGSKEFKQKVSTIVDYEQLVKEIQKFLV